MEVHFKEMRSTNWSTVEIVGDVSNYSKQTLLILGDCIPRIRVAVTLGYFQNVCNKLASVFLSALLENIWQLRRISKNGAGQLLLDLNGIKEYLLKLPNVRLPEGTDPIVISKPASHLVGAVFSLPVALGPASPPVRPRPP